jgi:superfamily II DNA or RNA helicase
VSEGYLASADFQELKFESTGILKPASNLKDPFLDYSSDVLASLGANEKRNLRILKRLIELVEHHKRLIYFAPSVDNSDMIAKALHAIGIEAHSVTSRSDLSDRHNAIANFKKDTERSQVLCNYGVLTTGFDAPRTSAVLIARPTKSLVLYSQMVGRAIRGPRSGGNESATIVTVVDSTLPGFGDVSEAFLNWEDVW